MAIWYIFPRFGILVFWQPWFVEKKKYVAFKAGLSTLEKEKRRKGFNFFSRVNRAKTGSLD
jgi:hypothetical protein